MQSKEPDCNFTCISICTQLFQFNEYNNNPKRNVDHTMYLILNLMDWIHGALKTYCQNAILNQFLIK